MDPNLMGILLFVMAILMVVLPFAYIVNRREQQHKERKLALEARVEEAKAAQIAQRDESQAHLEDRLRVLERIVTDRGYALADEIETLRRDDADGVPLDTNRRENA